MLTRHRRSHPAPSRNGCLRYEHRRRGAGCTARWLHHRHQEHGGTGTTQTYHERYLANIAYSPEFLVERRRLEDFANQDILVVGTIWEVADLVFNTMEAGVMRSNSSRCPLRKRSW